MRTLHAVALATALAVAPGSASLAATPAAADAPKPETMRMSAPPPLTKPLPVQEHVLPNGLKVLLLERRTAPVITVQVWYRVGSRNELVGKSGISHLTEHLMFQGSKNFPDKTYDNLVERHGGNNNAFTTEDATAYYVNFPSDKLELALRMEADRMASLLLPPGKFDSERNVVKEERRWRTENSPFGMMWELLGATAYTAHPYRWPVVGWMSDLDSVTLADAKDHYKRFYTPNNAVVVLVGDFEATKALALVKKTFGAIPRGPEIKQVITKEPQQNGERRTEVIRDVETPAVMIAFHMGAKGDPDDLPLRLLDQILSSGRSSRLYHDLVYTRKLAQSVGTMVTDNKDPGLFLAYALPMPGHTAAELEGELLKALERVKIEDVDDRELQKAINQAEAGYIFGQQKDHELGVLLGQNEVLRDWRLVNDYVEKLRKVSKEDLKRVAKQTFTRRNRSVVTLVPTKEVKE